MELIVRRVRADLLEWFDEAGIPTDRRIGDLTLTMLGPDCDCTFAPDGQLHLGCVMKTKTAETAMLFDWALRLLGSYEGMAFRDELMVAGTFLRRWLGLMRAGELNLQPAQLQEFTDCMHRHLRHSQRSAVGMVPKHHMAAHMSVRAQVHGNPKHYSTFLDESLNLVLRTSAAFAHRTNQVARTIRMMNLQGLLGLSSFLFGASGE